MSAAQQIITVDDISADNAPAIYVAGGLRRFIDATKAQVEGEVPDLTTRKGRERIASLAAQVSRSKTAVEKPGRDYLKRLKEMPKVVEGELREFVQEMDALRDQVRQPLNEWQAAEDARVDAHNDGIARLKAMGEPDGHEDSSEIEALISSLEAQEIGESWEEFQPEALQAKDQALRQLRPLLAAMKQREAEQAELARLRSEAEAREKADREAAIAREAAERATKEAELKAERERQAEAQRASDEKAAAERRELELKLQAEQAERQAAQAEANRIAAEQRAEQERVAAAKRAEQAAEQARIDERRRADAAAAEIVRQQELREADKAHKAKINRAALEAFIAGGMPEACAKQAVTLIAQRKIPNISIQY